VVSVNISQSISLLSRSRGIWPFNTSIPLGKSFNGTLPGWNEVENGEFVAASIGLVTKVQYNQTFVALPAFTLEYYNGTFFTLSASSLQDITDSVDRETGDVSVSLPSVDGGLEWQVFAFYQNHTNYREQAPPDYVSRSVPQSPITDFRENGSTVVDHFSRAGAQVTIDFWEKYLLVNGSKELVQEVGNYAWEDSQEFGAGILMWWTPELLQAFRSKRGYDLTKYLPLIFSINAETSAPLPSPDHYYTNEKDGGVSYLHDYWQTVRALRFLDIDAS
jgi:hypothetical protein